MERLGNGEQQGGTQTFLLWSGKASLKKGGLNKDLRGQGEQPWEKPPWREHGLQGCPTWYVLGPARGQCTWSPEGQRARGARDEEERPGPWAGTRVTVSAGGCGQTLRRGLACWCLRPNVVALRGPGRTLSFLRMHF